MGANILLVEDEAAIADTILFALKTEGFTASWASAGQIALNLCASQKFDLVILDVGLPDLSGFELCRKIRGSSQVPIFFLTARSEEIDRIVGLELGADDYIAKPFSPRELTARIKALFRRIAGVNGKSINNLSPRICGKFIVDEERARILFADKPLELTKTEFKFLALLLKRPGKVFSRQEIMDRISDNPDMSLDRTIDSHVKLLRAKLREADPDHEWILTHRGFGYALSEGIE